MSPAKASGERSQHTPELLPLSTGNFLSQSLQDLQLATSLPGDLRNSGVFSKAASLSQKAKVSAVSAVGESFLPTLKPSSQPGRLQRASPRLRRNRDAKSSAAPTDSPGICGWSSTSSQGTDPLPLSRPSAHASGRQKKSQLHG